MKKLSLDSLVCGLVLASIFASGCSNSSNNETCLCVISVNGQSETLSCGESACIGGRGKMCTSEGSVDNASACTANGDAGLGDTGATNLGARCGYASGCVRASSNLWCSSTTGTQQYQCCIPAAPQANAGCTKTTHGNEDIDVYCCTGTP